MEFDDDKLTEEEYSKLWLKSTTVCAGEISFHISSEQPLFMYDSGPFGIKQGCAYYKYDCQHVLKEKFLDPENLFSSNIGSALKKKGDRKELVIAAITESFQTYNLDMCRFSAVFELIDKSLFVEYYADFGRQKMVNQLIFYSDLSIKDSSWVILYFPHLASS